MASTTLAKSPAGIPCGAPPGPTSTAVAVPRTVPALEGQAWVPEVVPGGALPRLVQRKMTIPPLIARAPK